MPALPNVPNVLKVAVHQSYGGAVPVVNTFHLRWVGGIDNTSVAQLAHTTHTAWAETITIAQHPSMHLLDVEVTDLTSPTGPQARFSGQVVGGNPGTPLPAGVAMVVSEHLVRRFRGGHPRMYLAGFQAENVQVNGLWSASITLSIQVNFTIFKTRVEAGLAGTLFTSLEMVGVSFFQGFTNPTAAVGKRQDAVSTLRATPLVDSVSSISINPKPASQRRRNQQ